jgi:NAD(P)-dependent dehydrogenase (short-subunit alcohol dehydrogenase family)
MDGFLMSTEKKSYLITGASSGIGRNTARRLLEDGHRVLAVARSAERIYSGLPTSEDLTVITCDFSDPTNVKPFSNEVSTSFGLIDGLVHCAGIQKTVPIYTLSPTLILDVFNINTISAMLLVSAFSKKGMSTDSASFVLISSLAAHTGARGKSVYAASKGALEGFLTSATPELASRNIRINALALGVVLTEMSSIDFTKHITEEQKQATLNEYPLGFGEPEDASNMIDFLLSDKARWITGQTFMVDGGRLAT